MPTYTIINCIFTYVCMYVCKNACVYVGGRSPTKFALPILNSYRSESS